MIIERVAAQAIDTMVAQEVALLADSQAKTGLQMPRIDDGQILAVDQFLAHFPVGARSFLEALPTGALSTGLRDVLANGVAFPVRDVVTLAVWAVIAITLAARYFRWE